LVEETGTTAVLGPVLKVSREDPAHLSIFYEGYIEQDPLKLSPEIIEWGWFDPDEMPGPMLPIIKNAIETAVKRKQDCGESRL
jgi:hypothetical protein